VSTNRPDERQLEDLTPDEITAIQAALTAMAAGAAARPSIPGPTITGTGAGSAPAWLSQAQTTAPIPAPSAAPPLALSAGIPPAPTSWFESTGHLAASNHPALRNEAAQTPAGAVAPLAAGPFTLPSASLSPVPSPRVVPVTGTLAASRDAAMRGRPPSLGRRRSDALPTRALAAAAGVAATLGLIVVLVPPDTLVANGGGASGNTGNTDPGQAADASGVVGDAVSPSDVLETPAPSPSPLATKGSKTKTKATPKATKGPSATARPAAGGNTGSSGGSSGGGAATPKPTAKAGPTAKPTPKPTPRPTPQPTPRPTPKPTPVPTAASGKP